jgi:SCY1-like protein 2
LGCLPSVLATLDFTTIKNELFPVVAAVFSKTSSLGIKIRGLEAFVILCGGSPSDSSEDGDGLSGAANDSKTQRPNSSAILDKYTVQEKVVPLLKAMKTKEPAVMMAALAVFKQVGKIADSEFLAMDVLPILWTFSLGPLLNLQQFQEFMTLIKALSAKIEQEQTRKLRDLASNSSSSMENARSNDLMNMGSSNGIGSSSGGDDVGENNFERLVLGKGTSNGSDMLSDTLRPQPQRAQSTTTPTTVFSWSTPSLSPNPNQRNTPALSSNGVFSTQPSSRAITPDQTLSAFTALKPAPPGTTNATANGLSSFAPMQPTNAMSSFPSMQPMQPVSATTPSWTFNPPQSQSTQFPSLQPHHHPPTHTAFPTFSIAPPPSATSQQPHYGAGLGRSTSATMARPQQPQQQKKGLDAFESLL